MGAPQPAILPLQLSSASSRDYELLVDTLEKQFGHLDGILHNAGILGERTELAHYPVDVWDDVMAVNLRAPFLLTQTLLPLLQKSEHASVVFASSGVGREARERWGPTLYQKLPLKQSIRFLPKKMFIPMCVLTVLIRAQHGRPCVPKPIRMKIQKPWQPLK